MQKKRREHRDPAAKEWACRCQVERIGQGARPGPLNPKSVGIATIATNDGALSLGAKMMIARKTLVTGETAISRPSNTDTLAYLQPFRLLAEGDNRTHRFVTGN